MCKMVKRGLIATAAGAGLLFLAFGTEAPSYVRTAFHKMRHNVKRAVPIDVEIQRARQEVDNLVPALQDSIENLAYAEQEVADLKGEIAQLAANHGKEKAAIVALRDTLAEGDFRLASNGSRTAQEIGQDVQRRLDNYRQVEQILKYKRHTLASKERDVQAAQEQLKSIKEQKVALTARIDEIEAKYNSIQATESRSNLSFDDTPLARAKQIIGEVEKRVEHRARVGELRRGMGDDESARPAKPADELIREVDETFGPAAPATADRSL